MGLCCSNLREGATTPAVGALFDAAGYELEGGGAGYRVQRVLPSLACFC